MTFDFILVPNCIDYESYKHPCAGFEGVWVGGPGPPFPHLVNQFGEIHTLEVSYIDKKGNESTDVRNYWSSLNIIGCYIFRERPPPLPHSKQKYPTPDTPIPLLKKIWICALHQIYSHENDLFLCLHFLRYTRTCKEGFFGGCFFCRLDKSVKKGLQE